MYSGIYEASFADLREGRVDTYSVAEIREAERRCIEDLGVPAIALMFAAGRAVYAMLPPHESLAVVCGKGNNGGDGLVVAYRALCAGESVRVLVAGGRDDVSQESAVFLHAYLGLGGDISFSETETAVLQAFARTHCDVWVDATLGIGAAGAPRGLAKAALTHWPRDVYTVAVDVPSGMDADSGVAHEGCVRAQTTVTFQFVKRGFLNPDAEHYLGRLVVADIGIPPPRELR